MWELSRKRDHRYLGDPSGLLVALSVLSPWVVLAILGILRALASGSDPLRCILEAPCGGAFATYLLAFFASLAFVVAGYAAVYALRAYRIEVRPVIVAHPCASTEQTPCKSVRPIRLYLRSTKRGFLPIRHHRVESDLARYYREFVVDFENVGRSPVFSCTVDTIVYRPSEKPASGKHAKLHIGQMGVGSVVHASLFVHHSIVDNHVISFGETFTCVSGEDVDAVGTFRGPDRILARSRPLNVTDAQGEEPDEGPPSKDDSTS